MIRKAFVASPPPWSNSGREPAFLLPVLPFPLELNFRRCVPHTNGDKTVHKSSTF